MDRRKLTSNEIKNLNDNGCTSEDWSKLKVAGSFNAELVRNVNFNGEVFIGNNVTIRDVKTIGNYIIEDDVVIQNVSSLTVEGETSFGNGIKLSVLNEGGGRELMIYDKLSSQIAYILVTCRHDPVLIERLELIIKQYSESRKSAIGKIGKGSLIKNCGTINNVWLDESARLDGVTHLYEGTIASSNYDPIVIGNGVIAKHFIIQSGSSITDNTLIDHCFIGQGVKLGKQYSAENSTFFCNCEGFHGEAVSIFAGPYTVTHHKSTLLIAAMFSFYNAGSGSNQSNHMYKLGPLHQGILERGSKTGSFSYMLWPSRVGAFSVVIGKHYSNFDAGEFPFSYINEENGKSLLTPAMNLFTVGTRRDSQKWPTRDRRKDSVKRDLLNFDLYNPYVIGKILEGSTRLKELFEIANREQEFVSYKGLHIKRLLLKTCAKYYEMAVKIFIGQEVIRRISDQMEFEKIKSKLTYDPAYYSERWVDAAGMFIPQTEYELLIEKVKSNSISSIDSLMNELNLVSDNYFESAWACCAKLIEERFKTGIQEITRDQLAKIISDWSDNSIKLNNMILKDAEKEFDQVSQIGFGLNGSDEVKDKDFENVRGKYEENKFVVELQKESEQIRQRAENLISHLNK